MGAATKAVATKAGGFAIITVALVVFFIVLLRKGKGAVEDALAVGIERNRSPTNQPSTIGATVINKMPKTFAVLQSAKGAAKLVLTPSGAAYIDPDGDLGTEAFEAPPFSFEAGKQPSGSIMTVEKVEQKLVDGGQWDVTVGVINTGIEPKKVFVEVGLVAQNLPVYSGLGLISVFGLTGNAFQNVDSTSITVDLLPGEWKVLGRKLSAGTVNTGGIEFKLWLNGQLCDQRGL